MVKQGGDKKISMRMSTHHRALRSLIHCLHVLLVTRLERQTLNALALPYGICARIHVHTTYYQTAPTNFLMASPGRAALLIIDYYVKPGRKARKCKPSP